MKLAFIARNDLTGLEEDAAFAKEQGFVGLEFNYWQPFEELTTQTVSDMRAILVEHGVACSSFGIWGWNHISSDEAERKEALGHLERAIEFAHTLGASVLVTGGGDIPDASLDEKAAEFAKVMPPFVKKVEKAGMKMALYPVHGASFLDGIEAYEKVWEKVPQVGIKLDPANVINHGDDPLKWLALHGDRVFYVHIKEHLYLDGKLASQPAAGMGDVPWGKVMAFLYEHEYEGYLSMEPHGGIWGREPMRRKMLLLSKRYIQQFLL